MRGSPIDPRAAHRRRCKLPRATVARRIALRHPPWFCAHSPPRPSLARAPTNERGTAWRGPHCCAALRFAPIYASVGFLPGPYSRTPVLPYSRTPVLPYSRPNGTPKQYYTVLHRTTLYYTALHGAPQYYTSLHSATQYHKVQHSAAQCCTVLRSATPYYTVPHIHSAAQCCTVLHSAAQCDAVLHSAAPW